MAEQNNAPKALEGTGKTIENVARVAGHGSKGKKHMAKGKNVQGKGIKGGAARGGRAGNAEARLNAKAQGVKGRKVSKGAGGIGSAAG